MWRLNVSSYIEAWVRAILRSMLPLSLRVSTGAIIRASGCQWMSKGGGKFLPELSEIDGTRYMQFWWISHAYIPPILTVLEQKLNAATRPG